MSSAWGNSWGKAWGNSWGAVTAAVVAAVLISNLPEVSASGNDIKKAILQQTQRIEQPTLNLQQLIQEDEEVLSIITLLLEAGIFDDL